MPPGASKQIAGRLPEIEPKHRRFCHPPFMQQSLFKLQLSQLFFMIENSHFSIPIR
jgi:hypothetical protein